MRLSDAKASDDPGSLADSSFAVLSATTRETFQESAAWYDLADEGHFWFQARFSAVRRLLDDAGILHRKGLLALDVGCGNGVFRRQLESLTDWTVDGADLNRGALSMALSGRGRLMLYDVEQRHEALGARYDMLSLCDVLEHIETPETFLESAIWHLKPGGHILINVPALEWLRGSYDKAAGHLRRYTRRGLAMFCARRRLRVVAARYWGFSLLPLLALRRCLPTGKASTAEILARGFMPPSRPVHAILRSVVRLEALLLPRPALGTSVLVLARKR